MSTNIYYLLWPFCSQSVLISLKKIREYNKKMEELIYTQEGGKRCHQHQTKMASNCCFSKKGSLMWGFFSWIFASF